MRSAIPRTARRSTRGRLTAAVAACALLSAGAFLSAGAATASAAALAAQPRQAGTTLQAALHRDLSDYLTTRRTAEHWTPTGFVDTIRSGTMVYEERTGRGTGSQEVHPGV